ncbi:MAG: 2-succinyl-5-enolpyruvyl-6-hydroxy-3-cyclohexene-1-carboxylic-acid synthase [Kiritimatiellia bacterium]
MSTDPGMIALGWADQWFAHLRAHGVAAACLAPGSRSTALAVAAARCPGLAAHVHFDERGLGFFALGLARATRAPVAVVTTSGTAVANLLPAVIEAWHDRVPLILLTADRPPELRDNAANQSIQQCGIFGPHVAGFFDVPCPDEKIPAAFIASITAHAIARSALGPVHLNLQFREPFLPGELPPFPASPPVRASHPAVRMPDAGALRELAGRINNGTPGVVVAGQMEDDAEVQAAARLANALGWPVAADLTSGLNRVGGCGPAGSLDLMLVDPARVPAAGLCLHVGGRLVSKRLAGWMSTRVREVVRVAPDDARLDPDLSVHTRFQCGVEDFVTGLLPLISQFDVPDPGLASVVEAFGQRLGDALAPLWDPSADAELSEIDAVRIARGSSWAKRTCSSATVFRCASSTASSAASWSARRWPRQASGRRHRRQHRHPRRHRRRCPAGRRVIGFVGDLTLALHDLNSLALLAKSPVPVAFVINNDGGGIFSPPSGSGRQPSVFERALHHPARAEVRGRPHGRPQLPARGDRRGTWSTPPGR